ncbi:MAG: DUF6713 family protein [Cyanobacteria bacterium P01_D01_bin.36]
MGLATLLTHELDAMTHQEWQLLFILRKLPESLAKQLFVILHIPLISILLWLINNESMIVEQWAKIAISLFLIVHTGLHHRLRNHRRDTFHSLLSTTLIYISGVLGLLHILTI